MDENLREAAELPEGGEAVVPKAAEPEADEPKTKSIRFAPSAYDPRGIEQWLAERAAEGKLLLRGDDFVIGEPRDCRYHLEPARDDGDPDERLRETRAQMGWEYVCRTQDGIFYIWRGDRTARAPSPRPCTDSYAYRRLRKKLRRSYFLPAIYLAVDVWLVWFLFHALHLPVLSLLTTGKSDVIQFASIILGSILGVLSEAKERNEMWTLKRAMEACERVEKMPRNRWAKANRALTVIVGVLALALIFWRADNTASGDCYDEPPLPYLSAEALGGRRKSDWYGVRELSTPLGGHVYSVGETPYAARVNDWEQYSTELDFCAPRISALAKPLTHELRDYFMTEQFARPLALEGFDEAYYFSEAPGSGRSYYEGGVLKKGYPPQYLLLRRGGQVLFYRAEAPESLLGHLDEFAEIFDRYGGEQ